jgi:hypothetical protein
VFCKFSLCVEVTSFILLIVFFIGIFCSLQLSAKVIPFICLLFFLLVCSIALFPVSPLSHVTLGNVYDSNQL